MEGEVEELKQKLQSTGRTQLGIRTLENPPSQGIPRSSNPIPNPGKAVSGDPQ